MTHTYNITGMTCGGCVAKAKNELLKIADITAVEVQLTAPQAIITMQKHIPVSVLQTALYKAGNYSITEAGNAMPHTKMVEGNVSWFQTYKPILLIGFYITAVTLLVELTTGIFNLQTWMMHFMAGFFLVFSFFKLLDLPGFADSYRTYDIIAKKWRGWGYLYAFIELALGLAYLSGFQQVATAVVTLVVMTLSIIGVLQSVLNKREIQCACLGAVFKLPMSTVTIIEDALMIAMSAGMLWEINKAIV